VHFSAAVEVMSSPLTLRARRYLGDAARAFAQAPVEGVVVVFLAAAFSYAIEEDGDALAAWIQLLVASLLLLAGAWTGTVLYTLGAWSARARWAATAAGAAVALAYGLFIPDLELASERWRGALLVAAAVLWVAAMPAFGGPRAGAVDRVRAVNGSFLLRVIGAVLYTGALYAGLALALGAIDNLFELDLDGAIYAHVWAWLFLVLAPAIIVGGLADYARPAAAPTAVGGVVHRMTAYLLPPLLALYYAILYAYTIRMAITGEVPKNLLSPMVMAAGALAALTLYLFEPRADDGAGARYLRYAPPLFLPLVALGVWAITLRTGQYGWTENRLARLLVIVVLAALAVGATVQLARRRRLALHVAPLALAAALLLASVGPWSALSLALRSQQARLAAIMRAAGVPPTGPSGGTRTAPRIIPTRVYDEFREITSYLAHNFGPDALPPTLAQHVEEPREVYDLPRQIGLQRATTPQERGPYRSAQLKAVDGVDIGGITVHRVAFGAPRRPLRRPGPAVPIDVVGPTMTGPPTTGATAVMEATRLRIQSGNDTLYASMAGLIGAITNASDTVELMPEQGRLEVTDSSGRRRGTLVVFAVSGQLEAGALTITGLDSLLLLDTGARAAR
jgi:hypothetical protein